MTHSHKPKVLEWKLNEDFNWVASLYGCLDCDETFTSTPLDEEEKLDHQHIEYVEGCFGCKIQTLELSTGDANSTKAMASKKWDAENQFFADAVKQGVNPDGVFRHEVEAALNASEMLGVPYNGDSMMPANEITPQLVQTMKDMESI